MDQLDGSCESKSSATSSISSQRRRPGIICCICAPPKPQPQAHYEQTDTGSESSSSSSSNAEPMRILSPRETTVGPSVRRYTTRNSSNMQRVPTSDQLDFSTVDEEYQELSGRSGPSMEITTENGPIDIAQQSLQHEQSGIWRVIPSLGGSPTKEDALHSHPIEREDLEVAEEDFVTPAEDGGNLSEYVGRG